MKKHKLDLNEQIQYMLDKGIKFDIYKEDEAKRFLEKSNYFLNSKLLPKTTTKMKMINTKV